MEQIDLGDCVKDESTGIKGVVSSVSEFMTGCTRYGVTYGNKGDAKNITCDSAELTLKKKRKLLYRKVPFVCNLGDEVKDIISGVTGVIQSRTHYPSYNRYGIQRTSNGKDTKEAIENSIHLDEANLRFVRKHPIAEVMEKAVKKVGKAGPPRVEARK